MLSIDQVSSKVEQVVDGCMAAWKSLRSQRFHATCEALSGWIHDLLVDAEKILAHDFCDVVL